MIIQVQVLIEITTWTKLWKRTNQLIIVQKQINEVFTLKRSHQIYCRADGSLQLHLSWTAAAVDKETVCKIIPSLWDAFFKPTRICFFMAVFYKNYPIVTIS